MPHRAVIKLHERYADGHVVEMLLPVARMREVYPLRSRPDEGSLVRLAPTADQRRLAEHQWPEIEVAETVREINDLINEDMPPLRFEGWHEGDPVPAIERRFP
jgi:hypothetical protein